MDLQKLFETQEELDVKIVKEKGLGGVDLLDEKILALQVELGELANEWRGFKFWSENQEPKNKASIYEDCKNCEGKGYHVFADGIRTDDCRTCEAKGMFIKEYKNPLLEEYVDVLHFILTIGNDLKLNEKANPIVRQYETHETTEIFNALFGHIEALHHQVERKGNVINIYNITFSDFISLGDRLGFTSEQIEQAYFEKNKINHERQANGY